MTDQQTIINAFRQIPEILRGNLATHQLAEIPALFFFIKRLTDSSQAGAKEVWLSKYSEETKRLAQISWMKMSHDDNPSKSFLLLLQTIEGIIPSLSGLSGRSSLEYLARQSHSNDAYLLDIFGSLSKFSLGSLSCSESAEIFQQLLDDMADRSADNSVTPPQLRKLLVQLVSPIAGTAIYDPVCGSGSLLCDAARAAQQDGRTAQLFGQDLQEGIALIAKMHALLGNWDADIKTGNTLSSPQHLAGSELKKFDIVLANPPFGIRIQDEEVRNDRHGRFDIALPRSSELAFVQHIAKSLTNSGRAAIIVPNGLLSRGGGDHKVRKELIDNNRVQAVISLPANLFVGTTISVSILILVGKNITATKKGVKFIDLSTFAEGQKTRRQLSDEGISKAWDCLTNAVDQPGISRVESIGRIAANDYDLSVSLYVQSSHSVKSNFEDELSAFILALAKRDQAEQTALELLNVMKAKI